MFVISLEKNGHFLLNVFIACLGELWINILCPKASIRRLNKTAKKTASEKQGEENSM